MSLYTSFKPRYTMFLDLESNLFLFDFRVDIKHKESNEFRNVMSVNLLYKIWYGFMIYIA